MFVRSNIKGHAVQPFPHFLIPFILLSGLWLGAGGTLAFIRSSLKFFGRLKAVRGGLVKQSAKYWSWLTIDLQCLA